MIFLSTHISKTFFYNDKNSVLTIILLQNKYENFEKSKTSCFDVRDLKKKITKYTSNKYTVLCFE